MSRIIGKVFLYTTVLFLTLNLYAQETEENVRVEYILCKLNEGFTFADVIADAKEYGEKVKADGNKYNQYLMRPLIAGERLGEFTHVLVGVWPDGESLYSEYGKYVNDYIDEEDENNPHTCSATFATRDQIVVNDIRPDETMDKRAPVQLFDCNLKDGVSLDYAIKVQKEVAVAVKNNGMGGWAVHYQTPYLGFEDYEYDFTTMIWWQSFEHRGNMAQNFYKVSENNGQKMNSVSTCKNSRAYFTEEIFRTW